SCTERSAGGVMALNFRGWRPGELASTSLDHVTPCETVVTIDIVSGWYWLAVRRSAGAPEVDTEPGADPGLHGARRLSTGREAGCQADHGAGLAAHRCGPQNSVAWSSLPSRRARRSRAKYPHRETAARSRVVAARAASNRVSDHRDSIALAPCPSRMRRIASYQ